MKTRNLIILISVALAACTNDAGNSDVPSTTSSQPVMVHPEVLNPLQYYVNLLERSSVANTKAFILNNNIQLSSLYIQFYNDNNCISDPISTIPLNGPVKLSSGQYYNSDKSLEYLCSLYSGISQNGCTGLIQDWESQAIKSWDISYLVSSSNGDNLITGQCNKEIMKDYSKEMAKPCHDNSSCSFSTNLAVDSNPSNAQKIIFVTDDSYTGDLVAEASKRYWSEEKYYDHDLGEDCGSAPPPTAGFAAADYLCKLAVKESKDSNLNNYKNASVKALLWSNNATTAGSTYYRPDGSTIGIATGPNLFGSTPSLNEVNPISPFEYEVWTGAPYGLQDGYVFKYSVTELTANLPSQYQAVMYGFSPKRQYNLFGLMDNGDKNSTNNNFVPINGTLAAASKIAQGSGSSMASDSDIIKATQISLACGTYDPMTKQVLPWSTSQSTTNQLPSGQTFDDGSAFYSFGVIGIANAQYRNLNLDVVAEYGKPGALEWLGCYREGDSRMRGCGSIVNNQYVNGVQFTSNDNSFDSYASVVGLCHPITCMGDGKFKYQSRENNTFDVPDFSELSWQGSFHSQSMKDHALQCTHNKSCINPGVIDINRPPHPVPEGNQSYTYDVKGHIKNLMNSWGVSYIGSALKHPHNKSTMSDFDQSFYGSCLYGIVNRSKMALSVLFLPGQGETAQSPICPSPKIYLPTPDSDPSKWTGSPNFSCAKKAHLYCVIN